MKILMLSSGDRVPSSRFRMLPYVKHFREKGHHCIIATSIPQKYDWYKAIGFRLSQRLKRGIRTLHWHQSRWRQDDVVIIDREIFDAPDWEMELKFRETAPRLVLDLDDGVFLRYPEKFEKLVPIADLVICGNPFIEEWVKPRNENTIILPTCVEMAQYPPKPESASSNSAPRIGWIGTTGNLRYFQVAAAGLRKLAQSVNFELHVIVPELGPLSEIDLAGIKVVHHPWDKNREVEQLHQLDIGLMPLFETEVWDKYKCGLKLIQYMAAGIPAVASPVGVNASIVTPGHDGFLARSDDEWAASLEQLISDSALRRRMGHTARETAAEKYSIEANFPRYERALIQIVERQKRRLESGG
ncbi:MAG: glycosyltransferase family 4 protein [Planctomycetaceae bacterium]|nr:glycosyltransferase family 4 protein [Planctomycetaceae bacterium]